MTFKVSKHLWSLITIAFAIVVTTFLLAQMVTAPWHVMTELGADGGKNNFTYLYQVLYGKGVWFAGMNYPYGEHIVYTDGQPILSVPLSYLKTRLTIGQALSVMWWCISLSYVLAIVFLSATLRHFGVRPFIAMCFAALIMMCSPQILRLAGHYALTYTCVIPMLFYWTVKYYSSRQIKYPIYIFVTGVITSFLHPYFAAVILIWVALYAAGYVLLGRGNFVARIRHAAPPIIAVAGIFIVFGIFMRITDHVTDRPSTPYGILVNCAHAKDIISSGFSPVWKAIQRNIKNYTWVSIGGEGYSYLGFVVMLVIIISTISGAVKKIRKKTTDFVVSENGFQPIWLFIAVAALLFSMGAPFTWHMEWLLDYASALRQFRTLGRFVWIFYYIITVYGAVIISRWYERSIAAGRPVLAYTLLLLTVGLWSVEAAGYVKYSHDAADRGVANYDIFISAKEPGWEQFLAAHHYKKDSFQASLILRFFEVGSEKLWLGRDVSSWGLAYGIQAGMQLHLPMVDCMMSRTSWGQAFKQVKIAGGPYAEKPMLDDLTSDKPFLLLTIDDEPVEPDQNYLLEASDLIGHYRNAHVYACYPSRIKANDKKYADSISAIMPSLKTGDTCIRNTGPFYAAHFDQYKADSVLQGSGAAPYDTAAETAVAVIPLTPAFDKQMYEFSCWFLTGKEDYKSPYFTIEDLDSVKNVIDYHDALTKECTDTHGMWLRDHLYFQVPANTRYVRCRFLAGEPHSYKAMDELLLMPADALIISKAADGRIMVNNHLFKAGK